MLRQKQSDRSAALPLLAWAGETSREPSPKERSPLKVAAFFAGIGGIEVGLHRAGHATTLMCEWDTSASAVLAARFPSVELAGDIREVRALPRDTELLTAGFPCQPVSAAAAS